MKSVFALGRMRVRRSGYGAMQLGGQFAAGMPPDRESAIGVLRAAIAAGVDHIDTAQYYGPGTVNALIRDALYPYPDGLAIVSKVAAGGDGGGAYLRAGIEDNLRALRADLFHLADRSAAPLLSECQRRDIAFVPFCPLGWPRGLANPVLTSPAVRRTATRLGVTPPQVALQWLFQLAPNVLLIPGTGSVSHLRENLAAEDITLR